MSEAHSAMNSTRERPAWSISGYLMLLLFVAVLAITIWRTVAIAGGGSGVSTTSTSSSRNEVGLRGFVM